MVLRVKLVVGCVLAFAVLAVNLELPFVVCLDNSIVGCVVISVETVVSSVDLLKLGIVVASDVYFIPSTVARIVELVV